MLSHPLDCPVTYLVTCLFISTLINSIPYYYSPHLVPFHFSVYSTHLYFTWSKQFKIKFKTISQPVSHVAAVSDVGTWVSTSNGFLSIQSFISFHVTTSVGNESRDPPRRSVYYNLTFVKRNRSLKWSSP